MCFVISILMIVFSFNFFNAGNYLLSGGSFLISALFISVTLIPAIAAKILKKNIIKNLSKIFTRFML